MTARPAESRGSAGETVAPAEAEVPPTAVDDEVLDTERRRWTPARIAIWGAVAVLGGLGWVMLSLVRGETVNAIWPLLLSLGVRRDRRRGVGLRS